jgi:hypothetical protein
MTDSSYLNTDIRKYLLGCLNNDAICRQIEERLMTEDDYFEECSMEESELIQDYADEYLSAGEIKCFHEQFFFGEARQEILKFSLALRRLVNKLVGLKDQAG